MWRKALITGIALALGVIIFSTNSWAACVQADLKGTWRVYSISADGSGAFWVYGTLVILSDGSLKLGTTFKTVEGDSFTVKGGKLKLSSACVITGSIKLSGGITITVNSGALGKDKSYFTLVGKDNDGEPSMASGIKK
jgi:hypothetical protein